MLLERFRTIGKKEFDLSEFKKLDDTGDMIKYAEERLQKLGEGSSRVTYALTSKKVLKIAYNMAGVGQNTEEVNVYTNPKIKPIVAKVFDYDQEFFWITSELTRQLKAPSEFEMLAGIASELHNFGGDNMRDFVIKAAAGSMFWIKSHYGKDVIDFAKTIRSVALENSLLPGDLAKHDSWGKTPDGRLVLIDYGYSEHVSQNYY
jgi:hypothetical protein